MRTTLGAIAIAFAMTACSTTGGQAVTSTTVPPPPSASTIAPDVATPDASASPIDRLPDPVRILAIGDSYTEGTSIPPEGSWPFQLAASLGEGRTVELDVIAGDGWNAKRLDREFGRAWDGSGYDLVFVGVGANDVVLPFGLENYREGLAEIAEDVGAASADGAVLVTVSIPDFRASPWGQERIDRGYDIETYNEVLAEFADDIGATYVDVTTISGAAVGDPAMFADDDLHFSAVQYGLWVDLILDALSR